ncbi:MAG: helix-turn-helix domain-containing protein, partial [Gammaproteobacteria bacterium]|nr:helix-turn-helix domain-containing protein [Gammaproteobacteria bacterium]
MTDVNDDEATIIEPSNTISVGEQLRLAREEKKFTIAEVAAQLRLTRHTITHLEAEEWGKLHGRAYARGYFSNYVKFLGLPEDELLTAFNIEYKATEESLPPVAKQSLKNHKTAWILGAVTISMVFIIGITYQQWQASTDTDDNSTVSQWDRLNDAMDIFNASVVEPLSD